MSERKDLLTTPVEEISPERLESVVEAWSHPMPEAVVLENMPPADVQKVFEDFDKKTEEIAQRDGAGPLSEADLDEIAEEKLRGYANLKPEGRAIIKRGILKKLRDEQVTTQQLLRKLQENPADALRITNNFYMVFESKLVEQVAEGESISPIKITYAALPHYLNERYDNIWSRMCEDLTQEVRIVMEFAQKDRENRLLEDQGLVDGALVSIATYLHEKAGVSLYLLRP